MRQIIRLILPLQPLPRGIHLALAIHKHRIVVRAEEVARRIPIPDLAASKRHHAMKCRAQALAGQEPERVGHVDDRVARARGDVLPGAGFGADDLQAPLWGEEERDGADVGVHVLAGFGGLEVFGVVQEVEGGVGGFVVVVGAAQVARAFEVEGGGEEREDGFADLVRC